MEHIRELSFLEYVAIAMLFLFYIAPVVWAMAIVHRDRPDRSFLDQLGYLGAALAISLVGILISAGLMHLAK